MCYVQGLESLKLGHELLIEDGEAAAMNNGTAELMDHRGQTRRGTSVEVHLVRWRGDGEGAGVAGRRGR